MTEPTPPERQPNKPSRRDRLRPLELVGFSAVLAVFAGLVPLLVLRTKEGLPHFEFAGIAAGVVFIVVLLTVALAVVGLGRVAGQPARASVEPTIEPVATARVVVQQGDSLWNIAQRQAPQRDPRDTIHEIRELNGLRSNLIQPGQVILVPTP